MELTSRLSKINLDQLKGIILSWNGEKCKLYNIIRSEFLNHRSLCTCFCIELSVFSFRRGSIDSIKGVGDLTTIFISCV